MTTTTTTITGPRLAHLLIEKLEQEGGGGYTGKAWLAAGEVSLPHRDGGRVDVLAARKSWSNFEVRAHEVKVSRSDFFADVNAGKYRRYLTACHTVVFVVPAGLVKVAEVPDDAGLLVYDEAKGTWRMQRKPPRTSRPECLDERVLMALAMANDAQRTAQVDRLRHVDRDRDNARRRLLGKHHAKAGTVPADYDDELLLEWAMSKAGYLLSKRVAAATERAEAYDELIAALEAAGLEAKHVYGAKFYDDDGARLLGGAAAAVRTAHAMTQHVSALAALAGNLGQRLGNLARNGGDAPMHQASAKVLERVEQTALDLEAAT